MTALAVLVFISYLRIGMNETAKDQPEWNMITMWNVIGMNETAKATSQSWLIRGLQKGFGYQYQPIA